MGFLADKTVFSPLTKEILEESISFSCGNEDLDGFFHNDAVSYADNLFGKSYCYYLEESKADIVCAFTVSNASIFTKYLPNARKKKVGKHVPHIKQDLIYPAVLIGRLGINVDFRHQGIGSELLDFIKSWFVDEENKTGCRFIVVDAYNKSNILHFYEKNGFKYLYSTEELEKEANNIPLEDKLSSRMMYLDLIGFID